jgi:siroheme synthase
VENASLANEQRFFTTLGGLSQSALKLSGPALLMIGEVYGARTAINTPVAVQLEHPKEHQQSRC